MKKRSKTTLCLNILLTVITSVVVGYVGYWGYDEVVVERRAYDEEKIRSGADYFLDNATISEFNESGKRDYKLFSRNVTHFAKSDEVFMQDPKLENYGDKGEVTITSAEKGRLFSNGEKLEMWHNVEMLQIDPNTRPENRLPTGEVARLNTGFMAVLLNQDKAVTDSRVLVTSAGGVTKAVGMTSLYKEGKFTLRSQVEGVYEADVINAN